MALPEAHERWFSLACSKGQRAYQVHPLPTKIADFRVSSQKAEQKFKGVTLSKRAQYHRTELNTQDKHKIVIKIIKKTIG